MWGQHRIHPQWMAHICDEWHMEIVLAFDMLFPTNMDVYRYRTNTIESCVYFIWHSAQTRYLTMNSRVFPSLNNHRQSQPLLWCPTVWTISMSCWEHPAMARCGYLQYLLRMHASSQQDNTLLHRVGMATGTVFSGIHLVDTMMDGHGRWIFLWFFFCSCTQPGLGFGEELTRKFQPKFPTKHFLTKLFLTARQTRCTRIKWWVGLKMGPTSFQPKFYPSRPSRQKLSVSLYIYQSYLLSEYIQV